MCCRRRRGVGNLFQFAGTGKVTCIGTQDREAVKPVLEAELASLKDLGFTAVWLASWLGHDVVWSGQRLRVQRDGKMVAIDGDALEHAPALQPGGTRAA